MPDAVEDVVTAPAAAASGGGAPSPADEVVRRTTFSHYDDNARRLARLCDRFGKSASEILRLGLQALEGNQRLYRHAIVQPVNRIKIAAHLMPAGDESRDIIRRSVAELEEIFAPPDPENRGA